MTRKENQYFIYQVKERLRVDDDVLINDVLEKSERLHDVVSNAAEYLNNTEHNYTLGLLRNNMCQLMQSTLVEVLDIMVCMSDIQFSRTLIVSPEDSVKNY